MYNSFTTIRQGARKDIEEAVLKAKLSVNRAGPCKILAVRSGRPPQKTTPIAKPPANRHTLVLRSAIGRVVLIRCEAPSCLCCTLQAAGLQPPRHQWYTVRSASRPSYQLLRPSRLHNNLSPRRIKSPNMSYPRFVSTWLSTASRATNLCAAVGVTSPPLCTNLIGMVSRARLGNAKQTSNTRVKQHYCMPERVGRTGP